MADASRALRREVLTLVALVVVVDATFIGLYLGLGLKSGSAALKLGYTVLWTAITLAVVLRSLGRIRRARVEARRGR